MSATSSSVGCGETVSRDLDAAACGEFHATMHRIDIMQQAQGCWTFAVDGVPSAITCSTGADAFQAAERDLDSLTGFVTLTDE